jgi:LysM repeat protein
MTTSLTVSSLTGSSRMTSSNETGSAVGNRAMTPAGQRARQRRARRDGRRPMVGTVFVAPRTGGVRTAGSGRVTAPKRVPASRWVSVITLAVFLFVGAVVVRTVVAAATESTTIVTVNPGDTLWSIANKEMPGVEVRDAVQQIEKLNGLPSDAIAVGDHLTIPQVAQR